MSKSRISRANFLRMSALATAGAVMVSCRSGKTKAVGTSVTGDQKESGMAGEWPLLEQVDATDSRQFCEDCATVLGWLLDAQLGFAEIDDLWGSLLG